MALGTLSQWEQHWSSAKPPLMAAPWLQTHTPRPRRERWQPANTPSLCVVVVFVTFSFYIRRVAVNHAAWAKRVSKSGLTTGSCRPQCHRSHRLLRQSPSASCCNITAALTLCRSLTLTAPAHLFFWYQLACLLLIAALLCRSRREDFSPSWRTCQSFSIDLSVKAGG